MKPFIDYYNAKSIIPVRQDIADDNFLFRREYLYSALGVPLKSLKNQNILEFGPGGGFNATATSRYEPESYTFVDASKASIAELKTKKFGARTTKIIESDIFDYRDDKKYDLVICEGVIPCQMEPERMLKHVASFCDERLVVTTMSYTSILSEICRHVLRPYIVTKASTFKQQTKLGVQLFRDHFSNLTVSTRPIDDWVQDMILHDWHLGTYDFTMIDVAMSLPDFCFYGSSPRFLTDERWYKKVTKTSLTTNDLLKEQYPRLNAFLLDPRVRLESIKLDTDFRAIELFAKRACLVHDQIVSQNSYRMLDDFIAALADLCGVLPNEFMITKHSINGFINGICDFLKSGTGNFGSFGSWWGMGQQYVSFMKNTA